MIHELSFQSVSPIATVSYYNHRIALNQAIAREQLASQLGKLATRLRRETGMPVVADTTEFSLLSSYQLSSDVSFQILSVSSVDIAAPRYRRQLEQMLNQCVSDFFRNRRLIVDAYKHRVFLEVVQISEEIEAQRFLTWNFRIDSNNYVFLAFDYSNEYYSRLTLEQHDLSNLSPEQPLVQIYDGKICCYVGIAGFTVSESQRQLGNISLLEYYRRKAEVAEEILSAIRPETPAILVKYKSKKIDKVGSHIPQLLKKMFTKECVELREFNAQVLSIDARFKRAIQDVEHLNTSKVFSIAGINISFETTPYCPINKINFAEDIKNNLDFSGGCFGGYPAQGLDKRKLLEKPEKIKAVVFHPDNWSVINWCNSLINFLKSFQIEIDFLEFRPYPLTNIIEIPKKCHKLEKYELALMFVPDKETFTSTSKSDPYPVLKREFIKVMLPSQAIEQSTLRSGFSDDTGYNLLLGILGKLGYCAWQLKGMPGEAQAFLGLDIGHKDGVAVGVAAFIVSQQGRVIGWFPANFQAHRETFDISALRQIIFDLINLYKQRNSNQLKHLVIHRNGNFQTDELDLLDVLMSELRQAGIQKLDAVEIFKSGYTRAGESNKQLQKWENPNRGWAWSISDTEVALMTTGKTEIKGANNFVSRPIIVRRRRGDTSPGFLAAQVYWLSEMHIGSTQTIRLPITTYYPNLAVEYALQGLLPTGLQVGCKLPF